MSSLLEELKTIKEEARCREQSEKESLLAMRQLHSAEVDALRRRLSYLESRWENSIGGGRWPSGSTMRADDNSPLSLLDRYRHLEDPSFRQPRFSDRSQTNHSQQNGLVRGSSLTSVVNPETGPTRVNTIITASGITPQPLRNPSPSGEESLPIPAAAADSTISSSSSMPTPRPERHDFSFGLSSRNSYSHHGGVDLDNDDLLALLPLPVKSQRKHNMMMARARAHFS